ncbi:MAG: hypothetical protein IH989_06805 [Planctomycetes bacterium]|nr:hypothetical protein [Planctomycetota bacterium]
MSISARLEDAQVLYEQRRLEGALLVLLVAIAATSRKRYSRDTHSDKKAFTVFVQDEIATITGTVSNVKITGTFGLGYRGCPITFPDLLYGILWNQLVHEASMPGDIRFIHGGKVLVRVGNTIEFNEVFLQGLANCVLLAPESQPEHIPETVEPQEDPATLLARLYDGPLDFRRVLKWEAHPGAGIG